MFLFAVSSNRALTHPASHKAIANGEQDGLYPRVSGQHAAYTASMLKAYRAIELDYPSAEVMVGVTERLTDKEIEALASYMQGLH